MSLLDPLLDGSYLGGVPFDTALVPPDVGWVPTILPSGHGAWQPPASGGGSVPSTRQIRTIEPLLGGGDLSADITLDIDLSSTAAVDRRIIATPPLTGGGDLSADVTLGVDLSGVAPINRRINTTAPLAGGGDLNADLTLTVDLSGVVPVSRQVATTAPLTGGGALSANRTLGIAVGTTAGTVAAGDAVMLRAANDFQSFALKAAPVPADVLCLEDSAAAGAKKRATLSTIVSPPGLNIATDLAPRNWWLASANSQTGGLVDALTDLGAIPKNFTASGTARAPVATDANNNVYLALNGSTHIYTAGVAGDFDVFHTNGQAFTLWIVFDFTCPTGASSNQHPIFGTLGSASATRGLSFNVGWDGARPFLELVCAVSGSTFPVNLMVAQESTAVPTALLSGRQLVVARYYGPNVGGSGYWVSSGASTALGSLRKNGLTRALNPGSATGTTAAGASALTMGGFANGGPVTAVKFYEAGFVTRPISDAEITRLEYTLMNKYVITSP